MKKNNYVEKTLSNGIKVYLYSDKNCKRTYVSYNVNYGTNGYFDKFYYEDKPFSLEPAVAHFLEHYLIEWSKYGNMVHHFNEKNYEFNGLTYPEMTSYYFIGIDGVEESIRELIEMVEKPIFTKDNVETVKNAIIEELKNAADNKYRIAFANNRNNVNISYEEVPINNNVLGSVKSTKKITFEDAVTAYNAYYNNENKFLVIGGNIDIEETVKYLEEIFSDIEVHPNEMKEFDYNDDFNVRKQREVIEMRGDSDFIIVTYKEKKLPNESNLKQDVCLYLFHKLKRIYLTEKIDELTKLNVILGGIGYSIDIFKDRVSISYYTDSHDTKLFEEFLEENMNLDGLNEKEFESLKKEMIVNELRRRDHIYSCFKSFASSMDFSKNMNEIEFLKALTLDEVKRIVSQYKFNLKTVTIVTNKKTN